MHNATNLSQAGSGTVELATTTVVVSRRDDGTIDFSPERPASCRTCGMCGSASEQAGSDLPGQARITIGMPMRVLFVLVLGLYGAPLAGLLIGTLFASLLGVHDLVAAAFAATGCLAAVGVSRRRMTRLEQTTVDQIVLQGVKSQ